MTDYVQKIRVRQVDEPRVRVRVLPRVPPLEIELQNTGTVVQWRLGTTGTWVDLIEIDDINASVSVGTVTTLPAGSPATVENVGTAQDVILDFGIPEGGVSSVNGETGAVVIDAGDIAFTPTGDIAATTVAGALAELDSEKLSAAQADALFLTPAEGNAAYQPLDADLTALATAFSAASSSAQAKMDFAEQTTNGINKTTLQPAAALGADNTVTLPSVTGTLVTGPTSATSNTLARLDTDGTLKTSDIVVDDSENISGVGTIACGLITTTVTAAFTGMTVTNTDASASAGPVLALYRDSASPAAADDIGRVSFNGKDNAGNLQTYGLIQGMIDDPTNGSEDGAFEFRTVLAGGGPSARLKIAAGVFHPSATGGDKGNNTINFGAVYDDNTLLTCYPFDAYIDGAIDNAKWDAKVPDRIIPAEIEEREVDTGERDKNDQPILRHERRIVKAAKTEKRRHEEMRKFKARLGTETDPLDLEKYIAHWKTKRHLTSLPNEDKFDPLEGLPTGAWIQRLIETVEIQAIHISQLHDRLKALESAAQK